MVEYIRFPDHRKTIKPFIVSYSDPYTYDEGFFVFLAIVWYSANAQ